MRVLNTKISTSINIALNYNKNCYKNSKKMQLVQISQRSRTCAFLKNTALFGFSFKTDRH